MSEKKEKVEQSIAVVEFVVVDKDVDIDTVVTTIKTHYTALKVECGETQISAGPFGTKLVRMAFRITDNESIAEINEAFALKHEETIGGVELIQVSRDG